MVTYEFYVNSYLGSAIPENAFSGVAARAQAALTKMKERYTVRGEEVAQMLAVCAMAEALYQAERHPGDVVQSSIGEVSVRYRVRETSLFRELYRRAEIYLDIYRGVRV